MAELSGQGGADVYVPKTIQAWRTLLNWISFLFQIFIQIIRGSPSLSQVPSFISPSFKPLPVSEFPESGGGGGGGIEITDAGAASGDKDDDQRTKRLTNHSRSGGGGGGGIEITGAGAGCDDGGGDQRTKRLTVVLDLDETLVCAYETSSLPTTVRNQASEAGLHWFELECVSSDKEYEGKPKVNYVTVFERPGLHEFLKQLSEFADLILFTAGLEGYARPLVDRIDAEKRFSHRLYRPSTSSTEYREHVKDLSCLSTDLSRTVIVDNNPFSFLLQPVNGIPCIAFSAGQPHDDQLLKVILPLLKHLEQQTDVRHALHERYHMPEWFEKHGIPCSGWTK